MAPGSTTLFLLSFLTAQVYEVLQYHKSPRYADLLPVLGSQSMVTSEGHAWRVQREAFNPGFSSSFLKSALPGFISCTEHLVQRLDAAAESQQVVLMHHLTVLTTLEVICKVCRYVWLMLGVLVYMCGSCLWYQLRVWCQDNKLVSCMDPVLCH